MLSYFLTRLSMKTAADKVFGILGFQYKPIEKDFLAYCTEQGYTDFITKYHAASSGKKIAILDLHASYLGL